MNPAYKSGWGGVQQGEFMVGQIVVVDRPGRRARRAGGTARIACCFA